MKAIKVANLQKSYGNIPAVKNVSFDVGQGEIFGFLGPNGAGKTTTIRCLMDFIRPENGSIKILGKDAHRDSVALKSVVGFLPAEVNLYEYWTGWDHINLLLSYGADRELVNQLIERLGFNPSLQVKKLSTGNKQKLGFILSYIKRPQVLVLDEPTAGLDPLLQNTIYDLLKEFVEDGHTVFMSSHNLPEVEKLCDRVAIIRQGETIEVEQIKSLKKKMLYTATVYFDGPFVVNDFRQDGIELVKEIERGVVLNVRADLDHLIKTLAKYNVQDLEIKHASLEEVFIKFYR